MKAHYYFLAGVVVATIVTAFLGQRLLDRQYEYQGSLINPPVKIADFQLTDQHGRPFRMSELYAGEDDVRAVLVFFGYTYCPDVCPITLVEYMRIKEQLRDKADQVRFIFVTVDPERDTPERLKLHMDNYDPSFIALTGDEAELEKVWDLFWIYQARQEAIYPGGYLIDHTSRVYVLDGQGYLTMTFSFGSGSELMAQDISYMIR
jgi:protein SCO1